MKNKYLDAALKNSNFKIKIKFGVFVDYMETLRLKGFEK